MEFSTKFFNKFPSLENIHLNTSQKEHLFYIIADGQTDLLQRHLLTCIDEQEIVFTIASMFQSIATREDAIIAIPSPRVNTFDTEKVLETTRTKGTIKCRSCGSHDVTYIMKQTRSADEGMTCICSCHKCHVTFSL